MIKKAYYHLALQDKVHNFNELCELSGIDVRNKHKVGDIRRKGRYKNKCYDFNSIIFSDFSGNLLKFLKLLKEESQIYSIIKTAEYKELYLYLEFDSQCNFEIDPKEIELMNSLELGLSISCEMN